MYMISFSALILGLIDNIPSNFEINFLSIRDFQDSCKRIVEDT
jgi:hypothetical protein